jgi:hypothetical protein
MRRLPVVLTVAFALAACATLDVGSDFDRAATFTGYRTFAWMARQHPTISNPLNIRRVQDAVNAELEAKGLRLATDLSQADLAVDFTLSSAERTEVTSYPVEYRGGWLWGEGYFGSAVDVRQYREGTLSIDLFDARSHQPVWHGWAKKPLSREDLDHPDAPLRAAVAAILARYPPR